MKELILNSLFETLFMVFASFFIGIIFGIPLAIILYNFSKIGLKENKYFYAFLGFFINAARSIPYIILTVLLLPISRIMVGSSIGIYAAIIPLGFSAILLIAKVGEEALKTVPTGLIEVGIAMGASSKEIIWKIIIPESLPIMVSGLTLVLINLVGFSAMAGAVGGGGLGDLAIRYGYQRYNLEIMFIVVVILVVIVQSLQIIGNKISLNMRK